MGVGRAHVFFLGMCLLLHITNAKELVMRNQSTVMSGTVDSCPGTPGDVDKASSRLNCSRDKYGNDQYICVPNSEKSALVELCHNGIMGWCNKRNCLEVTDGDLSQKNCTEFTQGCPDHDFECKTIYNYPACQKINTEHQCYLADPSCPNTTQLPHTNDGSLVLVGLVIGAIVIAVVLAVVLITVTVVCYRKVTHPQQRANEDVTHPQQRVNEDVTHLQQRVNEDVTHLQQRVNEDATPPNETVNKDGLIPRCQSLLEAFKNAIPPNEKVNEEDMNSLRDHVEMFVATATPPSGIFYEDATPPTGIFYEDGLLGDE